MTNLNLKSVKREELIASQILPIKVLNSCFGDKKEFEGNDVLNWVLNTDKNFSQWIRESIDGHDGNTWYCLNRINKFEKFCLFLLEDSEWLLDCPKDDCKECRERIEKVCSRLSVYKHAVKLLTRGESETAEMYIEKILTKLQITGYLYHVDHAFNTAIAIFKLRRDLLDSKFPQLLDIFLMRSKDQWTTDENLRKKIVQILEYYINKNGEKIDRYVTFDSKIELDLLYASFKALCIELSLYKEGDEIDFDINRARLYRYASFIAKTNTDVLLQNAYRSLTHTYTSKTLEFSWDQIKSVQHVAILLSHPKLEQANQHLRFDGVASVSMKDGKISLYPKNADLSKMTAVIPNGLLPHNNCQIYLESLPTNKVKKDTLEVAKFKPWWAEVNNSLYRARKIEKKVASTTPHIGDEVFIIIDKLINKKEQLFHCELKDDKYIGEGVISMKDIVPYAIRTDDLDYIALNGFKESRSQIPYVFSAIVLSDEGGLHFSMKDYIEDKWSNDEQFSPGYLTEAVVTYVHPTSRQAICVAQEGFTIQIWDGAELQNGDMIKVEIMGQKNTDSHGIQAYGEYAGKSDKIITQQNATINLLQYYADGEIYEPSEIQEQVTVKNDGLQVSSNAIKELIRQIDRTASLQKEIQQRYCLLELSKILSHIIENSSWENYYQQRQNHQEILQDFATNGVIREEIIEQLESIDDVTKEQFPTLKIRLQEVQTLRCFGKPDTCQSLFATLPTIQNERLLKLTNLVLAYNLLDGFEMSSQKKDIIEQINSLLDVKIDYQETKYFGEEDNQQEFKTSIVFIANAEHKVIEDINSQMLIILKVICSFLNSQGGTLFLGVNNSGHGVGLKDDLDWFKKHSALKVTNEDTYIQYLTNAIQKQWKDVAYLIHINKENANGRFVIAIKVDPCETPQKLESQYYYRIGSECRLVSPESVAGFLERRPEQYKQYAK